MTAFTLRVLRDDVDHGAAMDELERLWGAADGTPEADRLGVLTLLIDDYERRTHTLDRPDPIDAILARMEAQGLTRRDLERFIGPSGRVSEVLSRKRGLSIEMIRRLHVGLGIPLDVLVQPTGAPEAVAEAARGTEAVEVVAVPAELVRFVAHGARPGKGHGQTVHMTWGKLKKAKGKAAKASRTGVATVHYVERHGAGGWVVEGYGRRTRAAAATHEDDGGADEEGRGPSSAAEGLTAPRDPT